MTIGVAFILFTLATAGVKGFAFTLGIGTLVSLFTAVLATSAILGSMARTRLLRRAERARRRAERQRVLALRLHGQVALVLLVLRRDPGWSARSRSPTLGHQLRHRLRVRHADHDAARAAGERGRGARARSSRSATATRRSRRSTTPSSGDNVVQISVPQLEPDEVDEVESALDDELRRGGGRLLVAARSGPTFGEQIARTALIAVIASLLLISLYIGFRFEFKFAVPVLIALAHDLLITAGVYALSEREVTTSTVAALLTIMGYSLYDTIIVFDRIRENVPRMPRATFSQIANRSMSEVFTRSLATSFVVLMPVGALLLFGGETLKDFAFALLVGVASGAYSSIFIATPVLVEWKEREQVYMRRRRMVMEQHGGLVPAFATGALAAEPAVAAAAARRRTAAPPAPRPREPRRAPSGAPPRGRAGRRADGRAPPPRTRRRRRRPQRRRAAAAGAPPHEPSRAASRRREPREPAPPARADGRPPSAAGAAPRRRHGAPSPTRAPRATATAHAPRSRRQPTRPSASRSGSVPARSTGGAAMSLRRLGHDGHRASGTSRCSCRTASGAASWAPSWRRRSARRCSASSSTALTVPGRRRHRPRAGADRRSRAR